MERRNLADQPLIPEFERTWNHQPSYPRLNSGTAAFTSNAENIVVRHLNSVQNSNTGGRMDAHPVPYYLHDIPNRMSNNVASSYDPFAHPPRFSSEYIQHEPFYNQIGANNGSATSNSHIDNDIVTRKRKFEETLDVGRGNTSAYCYTGSSSNFPSSAEHAHLKPMFRPQYPCRDEDHFVPSHGSNNMLCLSGSHGSVRRHYGVHLGTSSALHSSSNMSRHFHSGVNTLDPFVTGQWSQNPVPLITSENPASSGSGTFNHDMGHPHGMGYASSRSVGVAETYNFPHRDLVPSPFLTGSSTRGVITGRRGFNQGTDYTTNVNNSPNGLTVSSGNGRMIIPGRRGFNQGADYTINVNNSPDGLTVSSGNARMIITGRRSFNQGTDYTTNVNNSPDGLTVSSGNARMIITGRRGFNQGTNYTTNMNNSPDGLTVSSGNARMIITGRRGFNQGTDYTTNVNNSPDRLTVSSRNARMIIPARYVRPVELVGHYNEGNGRIRSHYNRLSTSTDEPSARARWVSEGVSMTDQSAYDDSWNLYDQHHDMRLDIDNMSYEELLALGERIGHVSTGLSEVAVSKCLTETTYSSAYIPEEEEYNCAICLEAYEEEEQVAILNCSHDFHTNCITKWLRIKNVCPICKAPALSEH